MPFYIIKISNYPVTYMQRNHNNGNINTAIRFSEKERRKNKKMVKDVGYEYLKFDENGKLVVVPFEEE